MSLQNLDIELPVICNIEEAEKWAKDFKSILTVGPRKEEVKWGHKDHAVFTFSDTTLGSGAPTLDAVETALDWAQDREDLLVHCHAGISRSTSMAWGISIARGADPLEAFLTLKQAQPQEPHWYSSNKTIQRAFAPNRLIVQHLEKILGINGLISIRQEHLTDGW